MSSETASKQQNPVAAMVTRGQSVGPADLSWRCVEYPDGKQVYEFWEPGKGAPVWRYPADELMYTLLTLRGKVYEVDSFGAPLNPDSEPASS